MSRRKDKGQDGESRGQGGVGVDVLGDYGISNALIKRLRDAGVEDLRHLLLFNAEELADVLGLGDVDVVRKVLGIARDLVGDVPRALTASERIELVSKLPTVRTGVEEFDNLTGGLRFGSSYEFSGEFGSGKTIMAMQSAVASVAQYGTKVVYIDTEKTVDTYLTSNLLRNIAGRFGVDYDKLVQGHLIIYNPATVDELEGFIKLRLAGMVIRGDAKVVVVDSITALYRAQFSGRERLAERQQRLHYVLDWLRRLTIKEGILVIYTNQVVTTPLGYVTLRMPVGGNVLAHTVNHRWFMDRQKSKSEGTLKALDVPGIPPGTEVKFAIQDDGLH